MIGYAGLLAGRTALVTGGASGIGRSVGEHLLRAGARVVLADRDPRVVEVARGLAADASGSDDAA